MRRIMNLSTNEYDLNRFADRADLKTYYQRYGLNGLELLEAGADDGKIIDPETVIGVHLNYFSSWYSLWSGDEKSVLEEFGTWEEVRHQFGGTGREAILDSFRKNLEFARRYHPEYVVFHVTDILMSETVTRKYRYSDEEIVDAAAELLNCLFSEDMGFELLLENLWYPGLTMTRPEITRRLLDQVQYEKKGIMLDVGHLLHTNTALRTEAEGAAYIRQVMDQYQDRSFIRGVHFHQTLNGAYVEEQKKCPPQLSGTWYERMCQLMEYVYRVDSHRPFVGKEAEELITWLEPEYLVYEFMSSDRAEHERLLEMVRPVR